MRNHFFLLTVLAVTIWTSRGDQTGVGDRQNDFYLDDMEEGSGGDDYSSSFSSYPSDIEEEIIDEIIDEEIDEEISGQLPPGVTLLGSMHLNREFMEDYNEPGSLLYMELENEFILAMNELMNSSPLMDSYISTRVLRFSPGSVKVDFEVKMEPVSRMEESLSKVIEQGINLGSFSNLNPNASSLVIKPQEMDPGIIFTTIGTSSEGHVTTAPKDKDDDVYRPKDPNDKDDEVDVKKKNILDMILDDPIIIAAIVGGLIVILLSIILLFLFVVYRLKKKDEGSYSLDEPAKAKDPTAYWKETKEFYA